MEKKIEELKVVLEGLVLPKLSDGLYLIAQMTGFDQIKIQKTNGPKIIGTRLTGTIREVVAEINFGDDWSFCNLYRYQTPTVIAATELVDIAVEKILGMSCGYAIGK
jgi:hypothetical protein